MAGVAQLLLFVIYVNVDCKLVPRPGFHTQGLIHDLSLNEALPVQIGSIRLSDDDLHVSSRNLRQHEALVRACPPPPLSRPAEELERSLGEKRKCFGQKKAALRLKIEEREMAPVDYDTIANLQYFLEILERRGYSSADIEAIAHGNLLRFFRQAWS